MVVPRKRQSPPAPVRRQAGGTHSRFIEIGATAMPPGFSAAVALVELKAGVGLTPSARVGTGFAAEQVAAPILTDAFQDLAALHAFGDAGGWLSLRVIFPNRLSGPYHDPFVAFVRDALVRLGSGPVADVKPLVVEGGCFALGLCAERLFSPKTVPADPSGSLLSRLTSCEHLCAYEGVGSQFDNRSDELISGEQPTVPRRPADELVERLTSGGSKAAQVAAAEGLAYLDRIGELPPDAVERMRVASAASVAEVTTVLQPILERHPERITPRLVKLSLEDLRARMREAYELSGLTLKEIGVRMGQAAGGAAQDVRQLMARSENPSFRHLQSFTLACGFSLYELLNTSVSLGESRSADKIQESD